MSVPTLLDLAKLDAGVGYPIIEESVKSAPELRVVPASTILGTTMELTVRTGLPSMAFRDANQGVPRSKSRYETKTFQTHILDHQIAVDEQIVNGAKDRGRLLENHVGGVMESAMQYVGSQFYYGTGHEPAPPFRQPQHAPGPIRKIPGKRKNAASPPTVVRSRLLEWKDTREATRNDFTPPDGLIRILPPLSIRHSRSNPGPIPGVTS
jgi:hypothetical protein